MLTRLQSPEFIYSRWDQELSDQQRDSTALDSWLNVELLHRLAEHQVYNQRVTRDTPEGTPVYYKVNDKVQFSGKLERFFPRGLVYGQEMLEDMPSGPGGMLYLLTAPRYD